MLARTFLMLALVVAMSALQGSLAANRGILVPFYVNPAYTSDWAALKSAATNNPSVQFIAVINPSNGPGSAVDSAYVSAISTGVPSNLKFYGYVHTMATVDYLSFRDWTTLVKPDIDNWYAWYGSYIAGIFLDEAPNRWTDQKAGSQLGGRTTEVAWYSTAANYIHTSKSGKVILNPGSPYWEEMAAYADIVVLFEQITTQWTGDSSGACSLWTHDPATLPVFGPGAFCSYVRGWDGVDSLKSAVEGGTTIRANQTAALFYGATHAGLSASSIGTLISQGGTGVFWYYVADTNCGSPDWANCWGRLASSSYWSGLITAVLAA